MRVNFFEKELTRVQKMFNETFGRQTVCNLETRYRVILAIVRIMWLGKKIMNSATTMDVKGEIQQFVKTKNVLNSIFNEAEKCWGERRYDENTRKKSSQRSNVG